MTFADFAAELKTRAADSDSALLVLESIDSTNSLARRLVERFREHHWRLPDLTLVAWSQAAGRGRGAHRWRSPAGRGLYLTLLRALAATGKELAALPIAVSVALADAVGEWLPQPPGLKWPNDLLVGGRKLAGVLIEVVSTGQGDKMLLVGVGVNYLPADDEAGGDAPPAGESSSATSIVEEAGGSAPPSLAAAAHRLIEAIDEALEQPASPSVIERYRGLSVHRPGDEIRVRMHSEVVVGRFVAFDGNGHLLLDTDEGERLISAGELID